MSRIGWSDEEDFPGQFGMWQANCRRSLAGKKGQLALQELEAALLALPDKRLIAGQLEDVEGDVCAIGAVVRRRGLTVADIKADSKCEMEEVGIELGMPKLVAWKIVEINDFQIDGRYVEVAGPPRDKWSGHPRTFIPVTPEERYEQVLAWVQRQLIVELRDGE